MPDRPFINDVWLWTIGFNLHHTNLFNLDAHVTENFFKSLICTPYGWADTLPYYITSGIYDFLKIPLSEFWLYFMHVFLISVSIILIYAAGGILFNRTAAIISALLLAILPIDAVVFGSALQYHHAFLIFLQLLLVLSLIYYLKKRSWRSSMILSAALFLNAGTENLIMFPAILILQYLLDYDSRRTGRLLSLEKFRENFLSLRYFLIWLPAVGILSLNIFIGLAFRKSNLGMMAYVSSKYINTQTLPNIFTLSINQIATVYQQFFTTYFAAILTIFVFFIIKRKMISVKVIGLSIWCILSFLVDVFLWQGKELWTFRYSHYFVPLILISGYLTYGVFEYIRGNRFARSLLVLFFGGIFVYYLAADLKTVLKRNVYFNPVKAASFYVREHGAADSTVFQLVPALSARNFSGEYYFGKLYMEPPEWTGLKRQLFSLGEKGINDYKRAYGLKDFDFYIDYHDNESLESARHLHKVADIRREGKIIVTIYSPHWLPYQAIDAEDTDKLWDKKYANLKNLLQNKWCGLSTLRGYHHRIK